MDEFKPEKYSARNLEVLHKKRADYGSKNITDAGIDGLITRLADKLARAREFARNGTANFEGLDEVFLDVSNYGLIGQMLVGNDWDSQPTSMLVYLSGSIDNTLGQDNRSWKDILRLEASQHTYFDPAAAFYGKAGINSCSISTINRAAIQECDMLIANVGVGRPFGTIREIEYATQQGKQVLAFGYPELCMHVEAWDIIVCDTVHNVLEYIR